MGCICHTWSVLLFSLNTNSWWRVDLWFSTHFVMFCMCLWYLFFGWKGQVSDLLREWEEVKLVRLLILLWAQHSGSCSKETLSLPLMCFPATAESVIVPERQRYHPFWCPGWYLCIFIYGCVCVYIFACVCIWLMLPFIHSTAWHPLWYDLQKLYPKSWFCCCCCCFSEDPVL